MPWRLLSLCLAVGSLLVASYFGWALHRISASVLFREARRGNPNWPRPWPYPDRWLLQWGEQLDAENPAPPGTLKIHGELPRMEVKLRGWIATSALVGIFLAVLGLGLVPYHAFSVTSKEPVEIVVERLSARIDPKNQITPSAGQGHFQGAVWDSGFKVTNPRTSRAVCPLVVRGRFERWAGGGGTDIGVTVRLFQPVQGVLFLWFAALVVAIGLVVAMVESVSGDAPPTGLLLDTLTVLVAMALLSWAVIFVWFRSGCRRTIKGITQLLSPDPQSM